jgi:hypothetical protein
VNNSSWFSYAAEQLEAIACKPELVKLDEKELLCVFARSLLIGEVASSLISFAVPKSAKTRCHVSVKRKFPGFKSLCTTPLERRKPSILTIYAA